jgi:hypothetical protein
MAMYLMMMLTNNTAGKLFHVGGKYISIPQHVHYAYRGEALKQYSLMEYLCIIQVMPMLTKKIKKKSTQVDADDDEVTEDQAYIDPANYKNGRIPFDTRHPLCSTHVQMIRSSLAVPILAGKEPPKLPVTNDFNSTSYLKKGLECAEYYLTLFVPWDIVTTLPIHVAFDFDGFKF